MINFWHLDSSVIQLSSKLRCLKRFCSHLLCYKILSLESEIYEVTEVRNLRQNVTTDQFGNSLTGKLKSMSWKVFHCGCKRQRQSNSTNFNAHSKRCRWLNVVVTENDTLVTRFSDKPTSFNCKALWAITVLQAVTRKKRDEITPPITAHMQKAHFQKQMPA